MNHCSVGRGSRGCGAGLLRSGFASLFAGALALAALLPFSTMAQTGDPVILDTDLNPGMLPGEPFSIFVANLDKAPDDLCVVICDATGQLIGIEIVETRPGQLIGLVPLITPETPLQPPLAIKIECGTGSTCPVPAPCPEITAEEIWTWARTPGLPVADLPIDRAILPIHEPQAPVIEGGGPQDGRLYLTIDGDWNPFFEFCIEGRIHATGPGADTRIDDVTFRADGDAFQCATLICKLLEQAFAGHPRRPLDIDCTIEQDPFTGQVRICVEMADGRRIIGGILRVIAKQANRQSRQVTVIQEVTPENLRPGDTVTVIGEGFDDAAENHCLGVMIPEMGLIVPLTPQAIGDMGQGRDQPQKALAAVLENFPLAATGMTGELVALTGDGFTAKGTNVPLPVVGDDVVVRPTNLGQQAVLAQVPELWIWKGVPVPGGAGGPAFALPPTPPEPPECPEFIANGVDSDGKIRVLINQDWGFGGEWCINARIHTGSGALDTQIRDVAFDGEGNRLVCAQGICDLIRWAFTQQPLFGGPLNVDCQVVSAGDVDNDGFEDFYIEIMMLDGTAINAGFLSIVCKKPPEIPYIPEICNDTPPYPGDPVGINIPLLPFPLEDLCVVGLNNQVCAGLTPREIVDGLLTAQMPPIPGAPGVPQPFDLKIATGNGVNGFFAPALPLEQASGTWSWRWDGVTEIAGPTFEACPIPPPPGAFWLFSEPVDDDGRMSLTIPANLPWPPNSRVSIAARVWNFECGLGFDQFTEELFFPVGGTARQCAELIADVIRCSWLQQSGFAIDVHVVELPDGSARLTFSIPWKLIDWGCITVCVTPERPVIAGVNPMTVVEGGQLTIDGNFGQPGDEDDFCFMLKCPIDGTIIPLTPVSVTPTQAVVKLPVGLPENTFGKVWDIAVGWGEGELISDHDPFPVGLEVAAPIWTWRGDEFNMDCLENAGIAVAQGTPLTCKPFASGGPTADGYLELVIDEDWGPGTRICLEARIHRDGTGADTRVSDVVFVGPGTRFDCALLICQLLEQMFASHPTRPLGIFCQVLNDNGNALIRVCLEDPDDPNRWDFIDQGNILIEVKDCPPPVQDCVITDVFPTTDLCEGQFFAINGSGFGNDPDMIRAAIKLDDNTLLPITITGITDTQIRGVFPPIPTGATGGTVVVKKGDLIEELATVCTTPFPDLGDQGFVLPCPVWAWGTKPLLLGPAVTFSADCPVVPGVCKIFGTSDGGELSFEFNEPWPRCAKVDIQFCVLDTVFNIGLGFEKEDILLNTRFATPYECAQRLCEVINCSLVANGFENDLVCQAILVDTTNPAGPARLVITSADGTLFFDCAGGVICVEPCVPEIVGFETGAGVPSDGWVWPSRYYKIRVTGLCPPLPGVENDFCVVLEKDNGILVGLDVVNVEIDANGDGCIWVRMPFIPQECADQPHTLKLAIGSGLIVPGQPNPPPGGGVWNRGGFWTWRGDLTFKGLSVVASWDASSGGFPIVPHFVPPPCIFVGNPYIEDGSLYTEVDVDWIPGSITITARVHKAGTGADTQIKETIFTEEGTREECAQLLAQLIGTAFSEHPSRPLDLLVEVINDPETGNPLICIRCPDGTPIDGGSLKIEIKPIIPAPPTTFEEWLTSQGITPGDLAAQFNGPLGERYGLRTDSLDSLPPVPVKVFLAPADLPGPTNTLSGSNTYHFTFPQRRNDDSLIYTPRVTTTLDAADWTSDPMDVELIKVEILNDEWEEVTYEFSTDSLRAFGEVVIENLDL